MARVSDGALVSVFASPLEERLVEHLSFLAEILRARVVVVEFEGIAGLALARHAAVTRGAVVLTEHAVRPVFGRFIVAVHLSAIAGAAPYGAVVVVVALKGRALALHCTDFAVWIARIAPIADISRGATITVVAHIPDAAPGAFKSYLRIAGADLTGVGVHVDGRATRTLTRGVAGSALHTEIACAGRARRSRRVHAAGALHAIQSTGVAVVTGLHFALKETSVSTTTGENREHQTQRKTVNPTHSNLQRLARAPVYRRKNQGSNRGIRL
jgi:hypothetical protein